MGVRAVRTLRSQRQDTQLTMLVGSVAASLLVLAVLQYYALQGLEILQTRGAPAIAAAWVPPSEGTAQPERLEAVRAAMQHSWHGYETYAWGADELHPRSKKGKEGVMGGLNGFTGLGASIVDAMSTLHLMGLEEEFERATAWVAANMTINPDKHQYVSFFETTIRLVGGLLSAHDLSGYPVFLDKAHDVARRLLAAFDGTGTGILLNNALLPWTSSDENDEHVPLAELGSNLIELGTLSARTGNETFKEKAEGGLRFLHAKHPEVPLLGTSVSRRTGKIEDSRQSVGAPVDSYLEYLLKYWILTGKKDDHWRERWVNATDAALATLVVRPANRTFTFFGELQRPGKPARGKAYDPTPIITHLGCFYPGSMALGVISGAVDGGKAQKYLEFAESMAEACYQLYNITATGLAVDQIMINPKNGEFKANTSPYLQRPEVVESFFYLWRATHNERYREWGWSIMQALNTHCKVDAGYAGLLNPNKTEPEDDDTQQSWFLAETLKYMYLLFSDDEFLRLDEWVFNTEAHPMRADRPEQEQWIDWDWLGLEWLPGSRPKEPMRMPGLATVSSAHLYRQRRR